MELSYSREKRTVNNDGSLTKAKASMNSALKRKASRTNKEPTSNKLAKFATLADNKIELVHATMKNACEKHNLEMQILEVQLQKEKLQVLIFEKDLELKNIILEKERQN